MRKQVTPLFDRSSCAGREHQQALSAAASSPVRNSHSARWNSNANMSSYRRSQQSSASSARQRRDTSAPRRRPSSLGALAGDQVELGQLLALVADVISAAAVELVDDLEDRLLALLGGVCAASSRPMRRWVSARRSSGISA